MTIIESLRRASESLREVADALQALSDEVYQAGAMSNGQWDRAADLDRDVYCCVMRLNAALMSWPLEQARRDKASKEKRG